MDRSSRSSSRSAMCSKRTDASRPAASFSGDLTNRTSTPSLSMCRSPRMSVVIFRRAKCRGKQLG
jgi:hypothetical protein